MHPKPVTMNWLAGYYRTPLGVERDLIQTLKAALRFADTLVMRDGLGFDRAFPIVAMPSTYVKPSDELLLDLPDDPLWWAKATSEPVVLFGWNVFGCRVKPEYIRHFVPQVYDAGGRMFRQFFWA